jgi:glycosyltransferase involved in cell wall biosynthesis
MPKVLYASFDEVPSHKGASTHILAFCRAIEQVFDVTLLTLGAATLPSSPRFRHLSLTPEERNPLTRGLWFREATARHLSRERPDLYHFRTPWEGMAALDASFDGRVVYEVNGFPSLEWPAHYPDMTERSRAILRAWEGRCLERADRIVCPSEIVRNHILERYSLRHRDKIEVIPNGYFPLRAGDEIGRERERGLGEPLRLVYIGTLAPWQGLSWALRALRPLRGDFTLDVYAPPHGKHGPRVERRIRKLGLEGCVRLLPPVSQAELTPVLARYDLGLCPLLANERNTEQGCYPLKLIDYARAGLRTLAPDLPCVRQIFPDERAASLYAAGSLGSFRDVLTRLPARIPRARLEDTTLIDWDTAGRRLVSAYRALLSLPV